ncbi:MAG: DUF429 domain-containing protein [Chloroflexota bacterium]|nr:DUF429 domain-containing protein [Chloroflexota bacterium]
MILSTFQHLPGIGQKTERTLWESGVVFWHDWKSLSHKQLSIFADQLPELENQVLAESRRALVAEDAAFFAERLRRSEHYRIALSFPSKVLFLDIETTGLSIYYDHITLVGWAIGDKYSVYIQGEDDTALREALTNAKAIVTFNGSLFDIPFLLHQLQNLQVPPAHIDLRFLAKRVGLVGGQKHIEQVIGYERPATINEVIGETAPLLWHRYKRGDVSALKLLIAYNHSDIEGMKRIFDVVVDRVMQQEGVPHPLRSVHHFSERPSNLLFATNVRDEGIFVPEYKGIDGPAISFKDLMHNINDLKCVGIDLTGSEKRASGWCLLNGNIASTKRLNTDDEMVAEILRVMPHVVSIDSPLSLPKGRISVSDDDPGRATFGIVRHCERVLRQRGVNVYPALIPSMQNLTARGIRLTHRLRHLGIPVIESYPGAAQDIMNIPRKQAGLDLLKRGLADFGIKGDFETESISHDEVDAITAALVGVFFWSGRFEALGNEDEGYLIIPDVKVEGSVWGDRLVVGLSGQIGSGKSTAGTFLKSRGFHYGRYSQVLEDILRSRGLEPNRETLQAIGAEVNVSPGQYWLSQQLVHRLPDQGDIVIDGLRFPEDHAFMIEQFGPTFVHIHVDATRTARIARYLATKGSQQEFETADMHMVESGINSLASLAHVRVTNEGALEDFIEQICLIIHAKKQQLRDNLCDMLQTR